MRIHLRAAEERRSYDSQLGRFTDAEAIPCFRCGVCCQRWQPLIGPSETERLAHHLGTTVTRFVEAYARRYPFDDDVFQLNEVDGGCVFLRFEAGLAGCAVHEARPRACRDWDASLRRKECLDGLASSLVGENLLVSMPAYVDAADADAFIRHLRVGGAPISSSSLETPGSCPG